jgi:hypothetical protein
LIVGIDSHKDTLAACAIDHLGREAAAHTFPNVDGHHQLLEWGQGKGRAVIWAIEGSGSHGAPAAQFLLASADELSKCQQTSLPPNASTSVQRAGRTQRMPWRSPG